ncbi:MAG: SRPBCC family protein [Acidimicrobiia bacterium]
MGIRVEKSISATRNEVWSELANLATHASWMKDAVEIEFLGVEQSGIGTRMRVPTRVGPFRTTDILEVTGWVDGESITVAHEGLVSGSGRFNLDGDDPTSVIWEETLRFPWWLGGPIAAVFARPILRAVWRGNLGRLAERVAARRRSY